VIGYVTYPRSISVRLIQLIDEDQKFLFQTKKKPPEGGFFYCKQSNYLEAAEAAASAGAAAASEAAGAGAAGAGAGSAATGAGAGAGASSFLPQAAKAAAAITAASTRDLFICSYLIKKTIFENC
jgi:hypothetical protein